jgi:predicted membrane chloride channel (bestrophin family)
MKQTTKAEAIRSAIKAGQTPKEIAKALKVSVATVYTTRWQMRKESKENKATAPKPATPKAKVVAEVKYPAEMQAYIDDMIEIERQIMDLETIKAFLRIRIGQMEQNAKWQTKAQ